MMVFLCRRKRDVVQVVVVLLLLLFAYTSLTITQRIAFRGNVVRATCPASRSSQISLMNMNGNGSTYFSSGVFSSYLAAGEAVGIPMRWGKKLVVLTSGNQAISPFMLNLQRSIARLKMPFPLLQVPLDVELFESFAVKAKQESKKGESFHVLDIPSLRSRFGPSESTFRENNYNEMALTKWVLAEGFQLAGFDVLVTDPDVVMLRSPIGFFETLPLCDAYFHLGTKTEFDEGLFRQVGGYAKSDEGVTNFYNTGFMLLRGSREGKNLVRSFLQFARKYYKDEQGQLDDQSLFVHWIQDGYRYGAIDGQSDGEYATLMTYCNECLEYVKRTRTAEEGEGEKVEFSIYPLTPALFPNRPIYEEAEQHKKINVLPFMVHVNWIQGLEMKKRWMVENKRWAEGEGRNDF
jgi:Nucleotide-diphospho-sugar transferase